MGHNAHLIGLTRNFTNYHDNVYEDSKQMENLRKREDTISIPENKYRLARVAAVMDYIQSILRQGCASFREFQVGIEQYNRAC